MRRTLSRTAAALLALAALAGACAQEAGQNPLSVEGDSEFEVNDDLDQQLDDEIVPETGLDGGDAPSSDEVVQAALADVGAFWEREYEDLYGADYEPIEGGFWPYGPESEQPPCGRPRPSYSDIAQNAFYCPSDDLIAWDDVNLVPALYEEFGGFTLGIVFAHEFGHAMQFRADVVGDTIMTELQADCFAGAWTADVAEGNAEYFELEIDDLDKAIAGFLALRDGVGTDAADPAAHGTGFDRIGAFSEGFENGLARCADYPDLYDAGELVIVEVPFTSEDDFARGGDLPLQEAIDLALGDLEDFWTVLFTEMGETWTPVSGTVPIDPDVDEVACGGETYTGDILVNASFYCTDDDTIYLDAVNLVPALYEVGDYAVATELARQYAYAAQVRLGNFDNTTETNLQADCFAGIYASSGFLVNRENQQLVLSPGDLDEAVIAFLLTSDSSADVDADDVSVGTAFRRFDAYRSGFVGGLPACEAILGTAG
ncbi:MAG: neutral zinc metallopeptidase [Acidimicrobiales bacterium]|nr:neutral zinc metallopeptidase [Acidimicrobiales bacterium]